MSGVISPKRRRVCATVLSRPQLPSVRHCQLKALLGRDLHRLKVKIKQQRFSVPNRRMLVAGDDPPGVFRHAGLRQFQIEVHEPVAGGMLSILPECRHPTAMPTMPIATLELVRRHPWQEFLAPPSPEKLVQISDQGVGDNLVLEVRPNAAPMPLQIIVIHAAKHLRHMPPGSTIAHSAQRTVTDANVSGQFLHAVALGQQPSVKPHQLRGQHRHRQGIADCSAPSVIHVPHVVPLRPCQQMGGIDAARPIARMPDGDLATGRQDDAMMPGIGVAVDEDLRRAGFAANAEVRASSGIDAAPPQPALVRGALDEAVQKPRFEREIDPACHAPLWGIALTLASA